MCSQLVDQGVSIYAVFMARSDTDVKYRQIAADLRARIEAGEFPPGSPIPGRDALKARYGVAQHTVGSAIRELEDLGLVEARQGLGTFVLKARADEPAPGDGQLAAEVAELRTKVRELAERESGSDLTELLTTVSRLEANLITLYGKTGYDYPRDGSRDGAKVTARRGRAR